MSEQEDPAVDEEEPLSEWEQAVAESLEGATLPRWEHKARAATFAQGHRGLLDTDLDFPEEYLKGPAPLCYVWKIDVEDGQRVHAYADIDGGCFHLRWDEEDETGPQNQPVHFEGACETSACEVCAAAEHLSSQLKLSLS